MPGGQYRWEWVGNIPRSIPRSIVAGLVHLVSWVIAMDNTRRCPDPQALCGAPWVRTWAHYGGWIQLGFLLLILALTFANRSKLKRVT